MILLLFALLLSLLLSANAESQVWRQVNNSKPFVLCFSQQAEWPQAIITCVSLKLKLKLKLLSIICCLNLLDKGLPKQISCKCRHPFYCCARIEWLFIISGLITAGKMSATTTDNLQSPPLSLGQSPAGLVSFQPTEKQSEPGNWLEACFFRGSSRLTGWLPLSSFFGPAQCNQVSLVAPAPGKFASPGEISICRRLSRNKSAIAEAKSWWRWCNSSRLAAKPPGPRYLFECPPPSPIISPLIDNCNLADYRWWRRRRRWQQRCLNKLLLLHNNNINERASQPAAISNSLISTLNIEPKALLSPARIICVSLH